MFRENTEDLYAGVEFNPVPDALRDTLNSLSKNFAPFAKLPGDAYAISCKINTRKGSERIIRAAFEFAQQHGRKKVTIVHKANVVRATDGMFLEIGKAVAKEFPGIQVDDANIDAMTMWLLKNPFNYDVLVAPEPLRRHHLRPLRPDGRRPRLRLLRQHRREGGGLRADPRLGPEVRRPVPRQPAGHDPVGQDDVRLPRREGAWASASKPPSPRC